MSPQESQPSGELEPELAAMPLVEHLRELRSRMMVSLAAVVVGTIASLALARAAIDGLERMCASCQFQFLGPTEAMAAYFRLALVLGLAVALPVVLYQAVAFVVPGLHRSERRMLYLLLPGAAGLFAIGLLFGYFVVVPRAVSFLASFLADSAVPAWSLATYVAFVTNLLLVIGLCFQTPLVVFGLAKLGLATPRRLTRYRRHAILVMAVAAAALTPTPDPVTMLLLMVPMIVLYELGIVLARIA